MLTHPRYSWPTNYRKKNSPVVLGETGEHLYLRRTPHDLCNRNGLSLLFERLDASEVLAGHTQCLLNITFPGKITFQDMELDKSNSSTPEASGLISRQHHRTDLVVLKDTAHIRHLCRDLSLMS